jgi:hypothetical protein
MNSGEGSVEKVDGEMSSHASMKGVNSLAGSKGGELGRTVWLDFRRKSERIAVTV